MRLRTLLFALLCLLPTGLMAHPHVWTDFASEIVFDREGRIAAIRHHWRFDKEFSAYALQGLDTDRDGSYSRQELEPLARENVESLKDYDYFTFLSVGDYDAHFSAPTAYHLDLEDGRLMLHFTLPLATPLKPAAPATLQVYDPEYYVAFSLPSIEAVRLVDAPAACRLTVHPAEGPDASAAATLATVGADQRQLPADMQSLTDGVENTAIVACGSTVAAGSAADAAAAMAGGGDLTALPATTAPAAAQPSEPAMADVSEAAPAKPPRAGIMRRAMLWIGAWQTKFNRELTGALEQLREGGAFWWLAGVSFLYGIVHAAGPGHGKVVISSYLLANEASVRRGVAIAFVSAFVQACVAVAVIGLMAAVLNMTSMAIDSTARFLEAASFALVAALGFYLLFRKTRAFFSVLHGGDPHAHHHHHHHHHGGHPPANGNDGHGHDAHGHDAHGHHGPHAHGHHGHGPHAHSPVPHGDVPAAASRPHSSAVARPGASGAFGGAAAAVLSVGIRPCSGALVILVFALSQGVFWAGAASTFVMALGTALAVAALAALAVGAKGLAGRLARGDDRRAGQVLLGLEIVAALAIAAFGTLLFLGALYV